MKKMNKKGFTIVELTIVIAVIAILAAVLIPTFSSVVKKANESSVQQRASALYKEAYALDIADGHLDGKEGNDMLDESNTAEDQTDKKLSKKLKLGENESVTYSAVEATGVVTFTFTDSKKGYTAKFANNKWTVEPYKSQTNTSNGNGG